MISDINFSSLTIQSYIVMHTITVGVKMQADLVEHPRPTYPTECIFYPKQHRAGIHHTAGTCSVDPFFSNNFSPGSAVRVGDSSGDSFNAVKTFALRPLKHIRSIPESVHGEKS